LCLGNNKLNSLISTGHKITFVPGEQHAKSLIEIDEVNFVFIISGEVLKKRD